MKKLFILTFCLALFSIFYANAQEKSKKVDVPAVVKSAFEAKYPKAEKVNWGIEKPGEFEAEFVLNRIESSAVFTAAGQFMESETEIKESELPQAVKAALTKDFSGYKIGDVAKSTDAKGVVSFEIGASKGKEELELSFDANGKLLSKAVAKEEEEKD